jgi:tRNA 2-thiouridine synthesizing protein D
MKILTIILTDGPYISEYAEMAYKIAKAALREHQVNIFLYLDAVHILKAGQMPANFANIGRLFGDLTKEGATVRACLRCSTARGYRADKDLSCDGHVEGIKITSLYNLAEIISRSDKVVALSK